MGTRVSVRTFYFSIVAFCACEVPNPAYQAAWERDGAIPDAPYGAFDVASWPNTGGVPMLIQDAAVSSDASVEDASEIDARVVRDTAPDLEDATVVVMDAQPIPEDAGGNDPTLGIVFPAELRRGLVSYWPLDERDGFIASDPISGNDGKIDNPNPGDVWIRGYRNGGATFHRDNHWSIEVPPSPSINRITNQLTAAAWVVVEPYNDITSVISRQQGDSWHDQYYLAVQNRRAQFFMYNPTLDTVLWVAGSSVLPTDTWLHLAATYDGTAARLYVNGNLEGQTIGRALLFADTKPLFIGDNANMGTYERRETWNGEIDEVVLYERALSGNEIRELMTLQSPQN
jgi:Concanavalin A-like lectin/glucanases superfamily